MDIKNFIAIPRNSGCGTTIITIPAKVVKRLKIEKGLQYKFKFEGII